MTRRPTNLLALIAANASEALTSSKYVVVPSGGGGGMGLLSPISAAFAASLVTLPIAARIPAGNLVVAYAGAYGADAITGLSFADSEPNVYSPAVSFAANIYREVAIAASRLTATLAVADTITGQALPATSNPRGLGVGAAAFTGGTSGAPYAANDSQNAGPAVANVSTSAPVAAGDLIVAAALYLALASGLSIPTPPGWTALPSTFGTVAPYHLNISAFFTIAAAAGIQTFTAGAIPSSTVLDLVIVAFPGS